MIARTTFICAGICAGLMLLLSSKALSLEKLSTPELAEHCAYYFEDPTGTDAVFCVRYIQGFIDGAIATDERVIQNISDELDQDETFTERAARTRLGARAMLYGPTVYADFCLGEPVALAEVVEKVVRNLENRPFLDEQLLARDAVFYTLRTEYPCATDDADQS